MGSQFDNCQNCDKKDMCLGGLASLNPAVEITLRIRPHRLWTHPRAPKGPNGTPGLWTFDVLLEAENFVESGKWVRGDQKTEDNPFGYMFDTQEDAQAKAQRTGESLTEVVAEILSQRLIFADEKPYPQMGGPGFVGLQFVKGG